MRVWWSYLWRNLIFVIVSSIAGGVLGAVLGFILGSLGVPVETIQLIVMPLGFLLGLAISIIPLKMILGKDFGEFRLVLVSNDHATPEYTRNPDLER